MTIDEEMHSKETEIAEMEGQIEERQEKYEKLQLKILVHRKEDLLDLIQSIRSRAKMEGFKAESEDKRKEFLETELMSIENELFDLEKKYGEYVIGNTPQKDGAID